MERPLFSARLLFAAAAVVAIGVASDAVAITYPEFSTHSVSSTPATEVAAANPSATGDGSAASSDPGQKTVVGRRRGGAGSFPNLPVIDQYGHNLKFYDDVLKDKIVVIDFIYTTCQDLCPLTTARMAQLYDKLGKVGVKVGRDVTFISMTVDPERDTPERMKAFADAFDAGPGWLFLTGKLQDIRAIDYKFGDRSDRGLYEHRNEILLGNDATKDWQRDSLLGDIERLVINIQQMNPEWMKQSHVSQVADITGKGTIEAKAARLKLPETPGQILFKQICAPCHTVGGGVHVGPDLLDVTSGRDRNWLVRFIQDPKKLREEKDPTALALDAAFPGVLMPALGVREEDAEALLSYVELLSTHFHGKQAEKAKQAKQVSSNALKPPSSGSDTSKRSETEPSRGDSKEAGTEAPGGISAAPVPN